MNVTAEIIAIFDSACRVTTRENAEHYVSRVAVACERDSVWARKAICYWAGYFSHAVRLRVEATYGSVHPIFGPATRGPMDPTQAYLIGRTSIVPEPYPWPKRPGPYPSEP